MATTYSFSYTNTTGATNKVQPVDMKLVTNYAKVTDEPDMSVLSNKTASLEQPEIITYKARRVNKINSSFKSRHPAPVTSGVTYGTQVEDMLRITYDDGTIVDEPIVVRVNIAHPASDNWTNSRVASVVTRALGSLQGSDGASWRFEDLMRSALVPTAD